jgi:hypothetical protein
MLTVKAGHQLMLEAPDAVALGLSDFGTLSSAKRRVNRY